METSTRPHALAKQSIETGVDPLDAITKGFVMGVNQVGESFACGQAFLPELVMAGEAMKAAVATLEPEMQRRGTSRQVFGKVVLATVEGDIHEIGKSLVGTMLGASGFQVYDLGVDVPTATIICQGEGSGCRHCRLERAPDHDDGQAERSHRRIG